MDNTTSKNDSTVHLRIDPMHFPLSDEVIQKITQVAPVINSILAQNGHHGKTLENIQSFQGYLQAVNRYIAIHQKELNNSIVQRILYFCSKKYDPKIAQVQYIIETLDQLKSAD